MTDNRKRILAFHRLGHGGGVVLPSYIEDGGIIFNLDNDEDLKNLNRLINNVNNVKRKIDQEKRNENIQ